MPDLPPMDGAQIDRAVQLLLNGELIGLPTETVYGLAADARNPAAVAKIFAAKGRPADHPLIVHLPGDDYLKHWAIDIPDLAWALAEQFWPGPLTLILRRHPDVPLAVTGGQETVGVRVPGHPVALELLRRFAAAGGGQGAGGLAAPSANRFGRISPTTAAHVRDELGDRVPLVLDGGACAVGIESTIVDLSTGEPRILRPGMIGAAAIALVAGKAINSVGPLSQNPVPRVSGALAAHYAPRTPLELVSREQLLNRVQSLNAQGLSVALLSRGEITGVTHQCIAAAEPLAFAHDLYAHLRALDAHGADRILVEEPPDEDRWAAIIDRLRRAVAGSGAA